MLDPGRNLFSSSMATINSPSVQGDMTHPCLLTCAHDSAVRNHICFEMPQDSKQTVSSPGDTSLGKKLYSL